MSWKLEDLCNVSTVVCGTHHTLALQKSLFARVAKPGASTATPRASIPYVKSHGMHDMGDTRLDRTKLERLYSVSKRICFYVMHESFNHAAGVAEQGRVNLDKAFRPSPLRASTACFALEDPHIYK